MVVSKPGPGCLQFFTQKRSFALFCALCFALFCALLRSLADLGLRSFALFCVFLRPTAFRTTLFGNSCDKDFAELSGELSGTICLKTLVLTFSG